MSKMKSKCKYLVSIIVPVYNAEKYLKQAFLSVKRQTIGFENIQLILVDDCSKDGSYALISRWAENHPNVLVMQTPSGSGSASMPRNMGLDAAEADYIMFLDADDVLRPDAVELLFNSITYRGVSLADAAFKDLGSGQVCERRYLNCREGLYQIKEDVDDWFWLVHPIWTKIYVKSIIDDNNIRFDTKLRNGEDSLFLFQYMKYVESVWHVNDVIYEYRILDTSVSHMRNARYFLELADACDAIKQELSESELFAYYNRYIEEVAIASLDILCDSRHISDEQCHEILPRWYQHIKHIADCNLDTKVPIGDILVQDAVRDDYESYVADFFSLRKLYRERGEFLDRIFLSRGWKLITFINKLLRRG